MKAVFIEQYGGPDVLKYGDWPDPVAAPGEVVVEERPVVVALARLGTVRDKQREREWLAQEEKTQANGLRNDGR